MRSEKAHLTACQHCGKPIHLRHYGSGLPDGGYKVWSHNPGNDPFARIFCRKAEPPSFNTKPVVVSRGETPPNTGASEEER